MQTSRLSALSLSLFLSLFITSSNFPHAEIPCSQKQLWTANLQVPGLQGHAAQNSMKDLLIDREFVCVCLCVYIPCQHKLLTILRGLQIKCKDRITQRNKLHFALCGKLPCSVKICISYSLHLSFHQTHTQAVTHTHLTGVPQCLGGPLSGCVDLMRRAVLLYLVKCCLI